MKKTLIVCRWIFFIPIAIFSSFIVNIVVSFVAKFIPFEFISYIINGIFAAIALIMVGLKIAPKVNNLVKWSLISVTGMIGILSAIGSLIGDDKIASLTGIFMLLISLLIITIPAEKLSMESK